LVLGDILQLGDQIARNVWRQFIAVGLVSAAVTIVMADVEVSRVVTSPHSYCEQLFSRATNASQAAGSSNFENHELDELAKSSKADIAFSILKELALLKVSIEKEETAPGDRELKKLLRQMYKERYLEALDLKVDFSGFDQILSEVRGGKNANEDLKELHRRVAKVSSLHLMPWMPIKIFRVANRKFKSAMLSEDGTRALAATSDDIYVWNTISGALISRIDNDRKSHYMAILSADGSRVIASEFAQGVGIWNADGGNNLRVVRKNSSFFAIDLNLSGAKFATANEVGDLLQIWNTSSGKLHKSLLGHKKFVSSIKFSHNGAILGAASHDHTASLWDSKTGGLIFNLIGHKHFVTKIMFSLDDKLVVTASFDNTAKIWSVATGKVLATLGGIDGHVSGLTSAIFSSDGKRIFTTATDNTVRVWETSTGKLITKLEGTCTVILHEKSISPDGRFLVTAGDGNSAKLWDTSNGKLVASLDGHSGIVVSAIFNFNGTRILTASHDGTSRIFEQIDIDAKK
jgi:WD40 repeat protein